MITNNEYIEKISLARPEDIAKAVFCFSYLPTHFNHVDLIKCLSLEERKYFNTLSFEKRINSYLLGRYVAKRAVAALISEDNLSLIVIQQGIFSQPVAANGKNIQVSISHCNNLGTAVAFPETHPMGIDLEEINESRRSILETQITKFEKELANFIPTTYDLWLTLLWTAKEALSKVLRTGLTTPFEIYEIQKYELYDNYIVCYFKNFSQYKSLSFNVHNNICSLVYPKNTEINFNILSFREFLLNDCCLLR
mgnify:CR=1 FL=1